MFVTRVGRQIEAAHHNGPEGSKCYSNHGHSWRIAVEFSLPDEVIEKNAYGWGVDFHQIKAVIDQFDHKDLNVEFGPDLPPSAENLAKELFHLLRMKTGFDPDFVEVHEGSGNSVRYRVDNPR